MKSRAPFIWILIGLILAFLRSLKTITTYFMYKDANNITGTFFESVGVNFQAMLFLGVITSIIGLVITLILAFFLVKIYKKPERTDFIITAILGGVGIFFGMGLGGFLVMIGGIVGIVKSKKS